MQDGVRNRIRTIRLMEKVNANPAAGEALGITVSSAAGWYGSKKVEKEGKENAGTSQKPE